MKIENFNITFNLIKAVTFIVGLIIAVSKITVVIVGAQTSINTRFEALERKVENVTVTMTNQGIRDKNTRNRDSANYINRFNAQDEKLDLIQSSVNRISPYNQKPISSN